MVSFTFATQRHLIRLAAAPFISSRLPKCGWVPFAVCNAWQRSRTHGLRRVGEIFGTILPVCRPNFTKFSDGVGDPSIFTTPLRDCLCRISFRRYSPLCLEVVKNEHMHKFFGPQFLWRVDPNFLRQIVSAIYCPPFGKVWLSSVWWSSSAKPNNEVKCRIHGECVKTPVQF